MNEPERTSETSVLPSPSQEEGNMKRSLEHHDHEDSRLCCLHSDAALFGCPNRGSSQPIRSLTSCWGGLRAVNSGDIHMVRRLQVLSGRGLPCLLFKGCAEWPKDPGRRQKLAVAMELPQGWGWGRLGTELWSYWNTTAVGRNL